MASGQSLTFGAQLGRPAIGWNRPETEDGYSLLPWEKGRVEGNFDKSSGGDASWGTPRGVLRTEKRCNRVSPDSRNPVTA
jgi:hypothetical protein